MEKKRGNNGFSFLGLAQFSMIVFMVVGTIFCVVAFVFGIDTVTKKQAIVTTSQQILTTKEEVGNFLPEGAKLLYEEEKLRFISSKPFLMLPYTRYHYLVDSWEDISQTSKTTISEEEFVEKWQTLYEETNGDIYTELENSEREAISFEFVVTKDGEKDETVPYSEFVNIEVGQWR